MRKILIRKNILVAILHVMVWGQIGCQGKLGAGALISNLSSTNSGSGSPSPTPSPSPSSGLPSLGSRCASGSAPAVPPATRTFYVDSASGNDSNSGLTAATAWKTINKTNAMAMPGDLFLLSGTFISQPIKPTNSGTASQMIVYKAAPNQTAILDDNNGPSGILVNLNSLSFIVIDGIEIRNTKYSASLNGSNNIWFRNLNVHDVTNWLQISSNSSQNRVEDSTFQNCGLTTNAWGSCVYIYGGSNNNVVTRNSFAMAEFTDVQIGDSSITGPANDGNVVSFNDLNNPWASAVQINPTTTNTTVECNWIHNSETTTGTNRYEPAFQISSSSNIVRFNLIYNNYKEGLGIWTLSGDASNNTIYNNTITGNGGPCVRILQKSTQQIANNSIENNLCWNNDLFSDSHWVKNGINYKIVVDTYHVGTNPPWAPNTLNGNLIRNNLIGGVDAEIGTGWYLYIPPSNPNKPPSVYTLSQAQSTITGFSSNIEANPLFANSPNNDFSLMTNSSAINAGFLIPGLSYLGSAPDMGLYEIR